MLSADERHAFDIEKLVAKLRKKALVGVLVYEDETGQHECVDYLADMII